SAKDSDYLQNQKVFEVFYKALKGKRLIVFSGLFKEAMTKFKNGELDEYKEKDLTKYVYAIMYTWGDKKYLEMENRLLTDDELEEINGKLIDEKDVDSMVPVTPDVLNKLVNNYITNIYHTISLLHYTSQ